MLSYWKIKPCFNYYDGWCKYDRVDCQYAHGIGDLAPHINRNSSWIINYKKYDCLQFKNVGCCDNGIRCTDRHPKYLTICTTNPRSWSIDTRGSNIVECTDCHIFKPIDEFNTVKITHYVMCPSVKIAHRSDYKELKWEILWH